MSYLFQAYSVKIMPISDHHSGGCSLNHMKIDYCTSESCSWIEDQYLNFLTIKGSYHIYYNQYFIKIMVEMSKDSSLSNQCLNDNETKMDYDKGSCLIKQLKKCIEVIPKDGINDSVTFTNNNLKELDELEKELKKHHNAIQDKTYAELYSTDSSYGSPILKKLLEMSLNDSGNVEDFKPLGNQSNDRKTSAVHHSMDYNKETSLFHRYPYVQKKNSQSSLQLKSSNHRPSSRPNGPRHYKTELCKRYLSSSLGDCSYGDKCQFAHGISELRFAPRHPRYKTEICYSFHLSGVCNYGRRCDFIHDESLEKLLIIRLQNELFHAYKRNHPQVKDIKLVDLLGLGSDGDNLLNNSPILPYSIKDQIMAYCDRSENNESQNCNLTEMKI